MDFHKLPNLDLRLLVVFDEISKLHSLTLAANSLGITQSAISKSLQRLRHELGDTLFVRTQKGMEATPRAVALKVPIGEILDTYYERISAAPHFDPATSDRIFTIHASDLGLSALVPVLAHELKTKAPHSRLHAISGSKKEVVEGLGNGEIDLSVGAFSSLHESGIYQQRLYAEKYGSSVKSVGGCRLGELSKCMIERDFCHSEGSEAVRFSHGDFGLVVQPLDDAAGELFAGTEVVEDQFAVGAHGAGELLHRLDA